MLRPAAGTPNARFAWAHGPQPPNLSLLLVLTRAVRASRARGGGTGVAQVLKMEREERVRCVALSEDGVCLLIGGFDKQVSHPPHEFLTNA